MARDRGYLGHLLAAAVAATFLVAGSCEPTIVPVDPSAADAGPVDPEEPDDPEPTDPDIERGCRVACENMRELNCPGYTGATTADGTTCEQTCENAESSGVARFCPVQVGDAADCAALEAAWEACEN